MKHRGGGFFSLFYFKKKYLAFDLGYSSLVLFKPSKNINIILKKNYILIFGKDKNKVSNAVYRIKNFIARDSYKGKGIYFDKESILIKKVNK